jgi:hypothetical protein
MEGNILPSMQKKYRKGGIHFIEIIKVDSGDDKSITFSKLGDFSPLFNLEKQKIIIQYKYFIYNTKK